MSSKNGIGIAPLIFGIMLTGKFIHQFLHDPSLLTLPGILGGLAAISVGLGILLEWGEFGTKTDESNREIRLALIAIIIVGVGGLALVFT